MIGKQKRISGFTSSLPGRDEPVLVSDTNQNTHTHAHVNKHKVHSFYRVPVFIYLLDTSGLPLVSAESGNVPHALHTLPTPPPSDFDLP